MITKVLVTVMTYPTLSRKHLETVCTAGFREDGTWIRIFPIPMRLIPTEDNKILYHKWQWIEADLEQNTAHDDRPESYHIANRDSLRVLDKIDGSSPNWSLRMSWVQKNKHIFENMDELLEQTKRNELSLAVLRPSEVLDMIVEPVEIDRAYWEKLKTAKAEYQSEISQLTLFGPILKKNFVFAEKIPYRFKYRFKTKDGKVRNILVEDWELIQLYRNCCKTHDEHTSCAKVKEKYMYLAKERDLYFFMGTSFQWQRMNAPDPYLIIGVFYPEKNTKVQPSLFEDD